MTFSLALNDLDVEVLHSIAPYFFYVKRPLQAEEASLKSVLYFDVEDVVASDHDLSVIGFHGAVLGLLGIDENDVHVRVNARHLSFVGQFVLETDRHLLVYRLLENVERPLSRNGLRIHFVLFGRRSYHS